MSRSYKKTKIFGIAGDSDKEWKRIANRALRKRVKQGNWDLRIRDISDPWGWDKDGKHYWKDATDRDMSK